MNILICGLPKDTKKYASALQSCSCSYKCETSPENFDEFDGLLLPGGGDIDPSYFGEENHGSLGIEKGLDEKQFAALKYFVEAKKPVLGICKGMQVINVFFGGSLTQHLPTSEHHRYKDAEKAYHREIALPGTLIEKLYGSNFIVNTFHHQGCSIVGENLHYTAFSDDAVPEAVEHETLPIVGVQWHPERIAFEYKKDGVPDGEKLIRSFLNSYKNF